MLDIVLSLVLITSHKYKIVFATQNNFSFIKNNLRFHFWWTKET